MGPPIARPLRASDHLDAPTTQGNSATDIGDFYAWHTPRNTIVAIITFNGGSPSMSYDPTVLYTIHIDNTATLAENQDILDNDNDNASDIQIHARFGQNSVGDWGVQFLGIPGSDGPVVGPVQTTLTSGTAQAIAGVFDDPFFFDLDGFNATITNLVDDIDPNDIGFSTVEMGFPTDTFAGIDTMAVVVEFDLQLALDGNADNFLQLWATTGVEP